MSNRDKPRKPKRHTRAPSPSRHVNAEDVLPDDLLRNVQVHFRGGRLYVPSPGWNLSRDDMICRMFEERTDKGGRPGITDAGLAEEFGLSVRRIQQITSEAGIRGGKKSQRKKPK